MRFDSNINPTNKRAFVVTRRAPKIWGDVFHNLSHIHSESYFTTNDVRQQMEKLQIAITASSLQVKLARYVSKGILIKAGRNQFRVSPKGSRFFNVLENTKEEVRMNIQ